LGWAWDVDGEPGDSPNVLLGDVFSVDAGPAGAVISGDPMVAVEFDRRLLASSGACRSAQDWEQGCRTFYGRYLVGSPAGSVRNADLGLHDRGSRAAGST